MLRLQYFLVCVLEKRDFWCVRTLTNVVIENHMRRHFDVLSKERESEKRTRKCRSSVMTFDFNQYGRSQWRRKWEETTTTPTTHSNSMYFEVFETLSDIIFGFAHTFCALCTATCRVWRHYAPITSIDRQRTIANSGIITWANTRHNIAMKCDKNGIFSRHIFSFYSFGIWNIWFSFFRHQSKNVELRRACDCFRGMFRFGAFEIRLREGESSSPCDASNAFLSVNRTDIYYCW